MSNSTISENYLTVVLGEDVHVQIMPEVNQPEQLQELSENSQNDMLVVVLFLSLMGIMAILPSLTPPDIPVPRKRLTRLFISPRVPTEAICMCLPYPDILSTN